jgi:hypothetical protein
MLSNEDFLNFEKKFTHYLDTANLPAGFRTRDELNEYIKTHLSYEQRRTLSNKYDLDTQEPNDFAYIFKCLKTLPRALGEGLVVGITAGLAASQWNNKDVTAKTAGVAGAAGLTCWVFARQSNSVLLCCNESLGRPCR